MSLNDTKIKDVCTQKEKWYTVTPDTTVKDTLDMLSQNSLSSLPVLDGTKVVGFVDFFDIVSFMLDVTSEERGSRVTPPSRSLKTDDFMMITARSVRFQIRTLREKDVVNKSLKNPFVQVGEDDPLRAALQHFGRTALHRVAVVDSKGDFVNVLSQSDVVKYLYEHPTVGITKLNAGQLAHKSHKPLFVVNQTDVAIDAFTQLHESGFSGAGVVDDQGELVGNLSLSDVKGIKGNLANLLDPVSTFMKHVRRDAGESPGRLSWVIETCPFETLLKRMVADRRHRMFVVKSDMKPVGVVTLTTISKLILLSNK